MSKKILHTENEAWGFYGTMNTMERNGEKAWAIAFAKIVCATGCSAEAARLFLDSRDGRHFANCVSDRKGALKNRISAAVSDYRSWKITRETERQYGIPAGMAYLDGWCAHYEIEAETA